MISRRARRKPKNDDYRRLARYIADAGRGGEKCLLSWCAGCWSGDDEYDLAISEVEATQALNIRTTREKTYHLIVSFRPEDEAKLSPEILLAIEMEFAQALGFGEHQRHCGVHRNTDNLHIHVAYNQIHPERRTRHEPYFDYLIRDKLCRQLEIKYGLAVDNGRDPKKQNLTNDVAKAFEAHTGQESLFGYAQRHKVDIMQLLNQAKSWDDCHRAFIKYSLALKAHGNGLVIRDAAGKHSIKASDLDRSVSKSKLEKRFGPFQTPTPETLKSAEKVKQYKAIPLQKEPDRDNLYQQYQAANAKRQAALSDINQQNDRLYGILKQGWDKKRVVIKKMPMLRKDRQNVMAELNAKESAELAALRKQMQQKRLDIRTQYPFNSWSKFLRHQASQGNETALAILRSKKTKAQPDRIIPTTGNQPALPKGVKLLPAVAQMWGLFKTEGFKEFKYSIDAKGTLIFKLPDGGSIRDTGSEVHFSADNELAKRLSTKLAQARWGQSVALDGNVFKNSLYISPRQPEQSASMGMSR